MTPPKPEAHGGLTGPSGPTERKTVTRWQIGTITPTPTPEEVAAITAALAIIEAETEAAPVAPAANPDHLSMWVEASRRSAQRAALQRGPWRLSGRIARRSRA